MNQQTTQKIKAWNTGIIVVMVLMVAVIGAELIVPKPSLNKISQDNIKKQRDLRFSNNETEMKINSINADINKLVYQGNVETVTPKILAQVNQIASANKVDVKSFRPQKPLEFESLQRLPFTVLTSGKFSQVVSFVRQIDEQSTLFSVTLLQVSASDGETDNVTATIGMSAFIKSEVVVEPPSTTRQPTGKQ